MCLHATSLPPIPIETARTAKAIFPKGSLYLTIGDQIGFVFSDVDFSDLYAIDGTPAISPSLLAMVTIFQFMENLPDREAADAVRARIDWKYALHLALDDPGFDSSLLSDFRQRLLEQAAALFMFKRLLERLKELDLLRQGGQQRTDSSHVLSQVRALSRLELVAETMRLALEAAADQQPEWLQEIALPHWYERYQRILTSFRLPRNKEKREALALDIGTDGFYLLEHLHQPSTPAHLLELAEIRLLEQVWQQQFQQQAGQVSWRPTDQMLPAAELIATPHDPEARYTARRHQVWTGYRVHLTETCDADRPHVITQVETTPATTPDVNVVDDIQADLAAANLLPEQHLVDQGYVAGHTIADSQHKYGITLLGPVASDTSWQAQQPDGMTANQFAIDWERQFAICPEGQHSITWSPSTGDYGQPLVHIRFAHTVCAACPSRTRCVRSARHGRSLKVGIHFETIKAARQQQATEQFRQAYATRAGIEGSLSAAVRRHGLRRSRYIGQSKTHLQEVLTATAINLKRAALWLMGERPHTTRPPGLQCLAPA
jgi:transposase